MPEIKTRERAERPIKTLDRTADIRRHMKNAALRTKETAERGASYERGEESPDEYAAEKIGAVTGTAVTTALSLADRVGRQGVRDTADNFARARDAVREKYRKNTVKERTQKGAAAAREVSADVTESSDKVTLYSDSVARGGRSSVNRDRRFPLEKSRAQTAKLPEKEIPRSAAKSVRKPIKNAAYPLKTAERTKQAAQTGRNLAHEARTAAQGRRAAARTTAAVRHTTQGAKVTAKATANAVRRIFAATKALLAAFAAGGWTAVMVIIFLCLLSLLLGSGFGIFFAAEDTNGALDFRATVNELNTEFYDRIREIEAAVPHDVTELQSADGMTAIRWEDVLAVYAAKVSVDDANGMEVVTMDEAKKNILRAILWDMHRLDYEMRTETMTVEVPVTDAEGNEALEVRELTQTILTITLHRETPDTIAAAYAFTARQNEQLALLRQPEYSALWARLLGGFVSGGGQILSPIGAPVGTGIFQWPLPKAFAITSPFGYRQDPVTGELSYHSGTDIAAPEGTPILAAADGTVTVANASDLWGGGYGYHVKLTHADGSETLYAHCSVLCVTPGQTVQKGEVIAFVGSTGNSTGNHLHFEVWINGARTDAMIFFMTR